MLRNTKKFNVLILENEETIHRDILRLLQKMGFVHIYTAVDHAQALELASKYRFDILLSMVKIGDDYHGVDIAKMLQDLYAISVIFLCKGNDKEVVSQLVNVDFIGYLIKPFREEELQTLITIAIIKSKLKYTSSHVKTVGSYTFNLASFILYKEEDTIRLSKKEKHFFSLYFHNLGVLIPYNVIDEKLWPITTVKENTRRIFLYRIKKKFPGLYFEVIKKIGIIPQ